MIIKFKIGQEIDHQDLRLREEDEDHLVDDDPRADPNRKLKPDGKGSDRKASPAKFQSETDCSNSETYHSSVSDDDDADQRSPVNLMAFLSGWSRRDRRGKKRADREEDEDSDVNALRRRMVRDSDGADLAPFKKRNINMECTDAKRFECKTCDRSFSSFQALGGHRTSCSKIDKSRDEQQQQQQQQEQQQQREHRCKVCDKSFPSGQALGGHQRRHWGGPSSPSSSSSPTSNLISASAPQSSGGGELASQVTTGCFHRNLNFDLNELPSMDEE